MLHDLTDGKLLNVSFKETKKSLDGMCQIKFESSVFTKDLSKVKKISIGYTRCSNLSPRLSEQNCNFVKFPLSLVSEFPKGTWIQ